MATTYLIYSGATPYLGHVGDPQENIYDGAGIYSFGGSDAAQILAEDMANDIALDLGPRIGDSSLEIIPELYVPSDNPPNTSCTPLLGLKLNSPNAKLALSFSVPWAGLLGIAFGNANTLDANGVTIASVVSSIMNPNAFGGTRNAAGFLQDPEYSLDGSELGLALSVSDVPVQFTLTVRTSELVSYNAYGNNTITTSLASIDGNDNLGGTTISGTLYQSTNRFANGGSGYPYQFKVRSSANLTQLYIPTIRDILGTDSGGTYRNYDSLKYGIGWKSVILNAAIDNSNSLQGDANVNWSAWPGIDRTKPTFFQPWANMIIATEGSPNYHFDIASGMMIGEFTLDATTLQNAYFQEFKFAQCGYHSFTLQAGEYLRFTAALANDPGDGRRLEIGSSYTTSQYAYAADGTPLVFSDPATQRNIFWSGTEYRLVNNGATPITAVVPVIYSRAPDYNFDYIASFHKQNIADLVFDFHDIGVLLPGQQLTIPYATAGNLTLSGDVLTGAQRVSYIRFFANQGNKLLASYSNSIGILWNADVWGVQGNNAFPADYLLTSANSYYVNGGIPVSEGVEYILEIFSQADIQGNQVDSMMIFNYTL